MKIPEKKISEKKKIWIWPEGIVNENKLKNYHRLWHSKTMESKILLWLFFWIKKTRLSFLRKIIGHLNFMEFRIWKMTKNLFQSKNKKNLSKNWGFVFWNFGFGFQIFWNCFQFLSCFQIGFYSVLAKSAEIFWKINKNSEKLNHKKVIWNSQFCVLAICAQSQT